MYLMAVFAPLIKTMEVSVLPLLLVALTTLFFNLIVAAQRHKSSRPPLVLELVFDIIAWSVYIYFSGGVNNPLISILLPFVAIGAAVLPDRQAWGLGLLSVFAYTLLWEFHWSLVIHDPQFAKYMHLLGMWITFALSVGISVWFITRMTGAIRQRDCKLAAAREATLHNEWIVSLGGLAAGTAHELSTPLSTLGTLVEEMRELPEPVYISHSDLALMESQLSICRRALTRLTRQAGYPRAEGSDSCMADEWLLGLSHAWQALHPGAEIAMVLSPEISQLRLVPDLSLEQALRNLVDNAVKVHPEGVELSARCNDDNLVIQVVDRGPGIQQRTIQRLERGLPQNSNHGLGLGLALAKSAVERYGGNMEISTRTNGSGTKATVLLPTKEIRAS
jgi:two-component system sensor histidine kinase RegB